MSSYSVRQLVDLRSIKEVESQIRSKLTVFQSHDWLKTLGPNPVIFACYNKRQNVVGYLPLLKWKKNGLKAFHIPPYTQYYGPVIDEKELSRRSEVLVTLLRTLSDEAHIDFKLPLVDQDIVTFIKCGFSIEGSQTHIFSASDEYGYEVLSRDKKRDLSRLMNEVESSRLIVRENDPQNLIEIVKLWEATADRASFNPNSKYLQSLHKSFSGFYNNLILDSEGAPLAGTLCPYDQNTTYHLIGASQRSENSLYNRANVLSLFLAASNANVNGLNFDFEGSNISGIANFYRMMGGKPKIIYRLQRTKSLYYNILRSAKRIRKELGGESH